MNEEHKEYKISNQTIKDIIDNIPEEKWPSVMRDMEAMLTQVSGTIELIKVAANGLGVNSTDLIDMGDSITWVGDGKCENEINFVDECGSNHGGIKFGEDGVEVK